VILLIQPMSKFLMVVVGVLYGAAIHADFRLVQEAARLNPDAVVTEAVWQAEVKPGEKFDRIRLHQLDQLQQVKNLDRKGPVLLYLPGTNMNSVPSIHSARHNFLVYLATQGVTTYGLDYRTAAIPAEYSGDTDFMQHWDFAAFVADAQLAFEFIQAKHPGQPVYVAGFSRGASYAYALVGQVPAAGLIVLDGSFKQYRVVSYDKQAALIKFEKSGKFATILSQRRGWENRQMMMRQVIADPASPALNPAYKTIGEQLTQTLYRAWGPGAMANPVDGVSDIQTLAQLLLGYDRFFPTIQDINGKTISSTVDAATGLDDHFGELGVPLIYFGATNLGTDHLLNGVYSAGESGATSVELHVLENYGHLDVLVGDKAAKEVFAVVLDWLSRQEKIAAKVIIDPSPVT
jgi:hypothetical protein